jgi:hypothetical protein
MSFQTVVKKKNKWISNFFLKDKELRKWRHPPQRNRFFSRFQIFHPETQNPQNPRDAPPPPCSAPPGCCRGRRRAGSRLSLRRKRAKRRLRAPPRRRPLLPRRLHGSPSPICCYCYYSWVSDGAFAQISSRWLSQIGFVVADYKYSLRGLDAGSADYRVKLSEVWVLPRMWCCAVPIICMGVCKLVEGICFATMLWTYDSRIVSLINCFKNGS